MTQKAEIDDIKKLLAALPPADDPFLLVLKGHLVAEQLMIHYIKLLSPNPRPMLELERLSFSVRARFAESLHDSDGFDKLIWTPLRQLNRLRNSLAHELESKSLDRQIQKMIETYEAAGAWRPPAYRMGSNVVKLRYVIAGLHHAFAGAIIAMRENLQKFRIPVVESR